MSPSSLASSTISSRRSVLATLAAMTLLVSAVLAPAGATPASASASGLQEQSLASPQAGAALRESVVSFDSPLPASFPAHPAGCDRLSFLRVRSDSGANDWAQADAIYVTMPGLALGADSLAPMARNVVRASAALGRHVEVWAIDRRANCLEDHAGFTAGALQQSPTAAFDYYFGAQPVNGKTFTPPSATDLAFVGRMGLAQTVQDYHAVLDLLPASVRATKVMCGGHSLGALIVGAYANWDLDGQPGYRDCAGYFTLDSRLSIRVASALPEALALVQAILPMALPLDLGATTATASGSPSLNVSPLFPGMDLLIETFAQAAQIAPADASTLLAWVPTSSNYDGALRLFTAPDIWTYLLHLTDPRALHVSNQTALGMLQDDSLQPFGFMRASMGAPTGGPITAKTFPMPYGAASVGGLVGGNRQVSMTSTSATYTWKNYNALTTADGQTTNHSVYTSAAKEVTDINDFAAAFSSPTLDGTEWYFPVKLFVDTLTAGLGIRTGDLTNMRYYDGVQRHPSINLDAEDASMVDALDPLRSDPATTVVLPGYNHLDVATAAWTQNTGLPEPVSQSLAGFTQQHLS